MAAPRTCTLYEYHNGEVAKRYQDEAIFLDSDCGLVQWQCDGSWTEWHGEFKITADQLRVAFDSQQRRRVGPPQPKSATLFLTLDGTYEGYDYKNRRVQVTPKAKFGYDAASGAWLLLAEWSAEWLAWTTAVAPSGYEPVD